MWLVLLQDASGKECPLPGVRSTAFGFFSMAEADEFASTLHANFGRGGPFGPETMGARNHNGVHTVTVEAGEAVEVFPEWSF